MTIQNTHIDIIGQARINVVVASLLQSGQWFSIEPLGNDRYRVGMRSDQEGLLKRIQIVVADMDMEDHHEEPTDTEQKQESAMVGWDVYQGEKLLDTVFFSRGVSEDPEYARKSLIEYDGFPPNISVVLNKSS